MEDFIYNVPVKVYFGQGQIEKLKDEISKYGNRVLMVYGGESIKKNGLYDKVVQLLDECGIVLYELSGVSPNPKVESVRKGIEICKMKNIEVVLAVGGGSTIDAAKWIAAGSCVQHDVWDFFCKKTEIREALPIITILTLAATGSEMNCGGVISNTDTVEKKGRNSPFLFPKASFLNPEYTYSVDCFQTACGAADIISHVIEVYFNLKKDLYMLDCVMEGIMKTVLKYSPIAVEKPYDYEARANLMWAASWAINGFINGGRKQMWSCHSMEHELSARYDITHGLGLAILMPRWLEYCLDERTVSKYYQFGVNVFGIKENLSKEEVAKLSIEKLQDFLFGKLKLCSNLKELGINKKDFEEMASKICNNGTLNGFVTLDKKDIINIYCLSYEYEYCGHKEV